MTRGKILSEALEVINYDRNNQYGDPEHSFSLIAEYWTVYLNQAVGPISELDSRDVAYMMTLFKIAREAHQHKRDNLVDAAGYLGIAGDMHDVNETDCVEIPDHTCIKEEDLEYAPSCEDDLR